MRTPAQLHAYLNPPTETERIAALLAEGDFALLGEASHGTREFYEIRQEVTKLLIEKHGFRSVVIEGDWPDTLRIHRYVTGRGNDAGAFESLRSFRRFPGWMWRNSSMLSFVKWLRKWNDANPGDMAGIFGMDLYSLHRSIAAVLDYLEQRDPRAAARARERYECFDHFGSDPQQYGYQTEREGAEDCEDEVVSQWVDLLRERGKHAADGVESFFAEQNARVVANAEQYYRAMFRGRASSWNKRDEHMAETVRSVSEKARSNGSGGKVVVWAHNSHLGDARATEMGKSGEWNVGQLLREQAPGRVISMGFSTWAGRVTAAHNWDGDAEEMEVNEALPESYESLFHATGEPSFWLDLRDSELGSLLSPPRLQRAIGVIYRPDSERISHYFQASLPSQFDLMFHIDVTSAVQPLGEEDAVSLDRPHVPESEF